MEKGIYFAIDGCDGTGKSACVAGVHDRLVAEKISHMIIAQPTKKEFGVQIRKRLQDAKSPPVIDALLFAIDRYEQTISDIKPTIDSGVHIISDRSVLSSMAYQWVQGIDAGALDLGPKWILNINHFSATPSHIFLLDCDPKIAMERIAKRNGQPEKFDQLDFQTKLRGAFLNAKNMLPPTTTVYIIDATQNGENGIKNTVGHIFSLITTVIKNLKN